MLTTLQWRLLYIFLVTDLISFFLNRLFGIWSWSPLYFLIPDLFLVAVLVLNAIEWLRPKGFLLFFTWSALLAWAAESYAILYQPFGAYEFRLTSSLNIGIIPVFVLISWPFFIYSGYAVSNSLLIWKNKPLPHTTNNKWKSLLLLVFLDAFLVTAMDLVIDPIQQYEKLWIWKEGGVFYGVPLGNFIGWFLVTALSTLVYRTYYYFQPQAFEPPKKSTLIIPVLLYLLIALFYVYSAYRLEGLDLALIGALAMLPIPVYSLFLFKKSKTDNG